MLRTATLVGIFALAPVAFAASRQLVLGNAERGRDVSRASGCIACHSVNGEGGGTASDLARTIVRGYTPDRFAAAMWNYGPAMWRLLDQSRITRPELTRQQAADLFAYLYAVRVLEHPGDVRQGERIFRSCGCARCHAVDSKGAEETPSIGSWQSLGHPILLAQRMWRHPRVDAAAADRLPLLSSQALTDMLAYLRSKAGRTDDRAFLPTSPDDGARVFAAKGCSACHNGDHALEGRPTRYTLNDFAAAMWNHRRVSLKGAAITDAETRALAGYLLAIQFIQERGNAQRGEKLFSRKRCTLCHDKATSPAPPRSNMAGRMTSFDMVAALWNRGPAMIGAVRTANIPWPQFEGEEMADLTAYLHGFEFKPRATFNPPAPAAPSN